MPGVRAVAGLNFIRAAFCPLNFKCKRSEDSAAFKHIVDEEAALGQLEVGESLQYARQFPYNDHHKHRQVGTQIVTAPFGLGPVDFDLLLGIYSYLRNLEELPQDLELQLTINFIGKLSDLPRTCPQDYRRIQSRIFRLSYVKVTNSAAWNSAKKSFESLSNFDLFSIKEMTLLTESFQPVTLRLSREFARIIRESPVVAFDRVLYRDLSPALRRLYLLANREGWNQRHSMLYDADAFSIHQLGYGCESDPAMDRPRRKDRLHKLRKLLKDAEKRDLIRPYKPWGGYFSRLTSGPLRGKLALRWTRGPALSTKEEGTGRKQQSLNDDPLYDQIQQLRDEKGEPLAAPVYRHLRKQFGSQRIQKQVTVVLEQRRLYPGSFKRSEIATFVDRVKNDYPAPDWFRDIEAQKRAVEFDRIAPTSATRDLYQAISRSQ